MTKALLDGGPQPEPGLDRLDQALVRAAAHPAAGVLVFERPGAPGFERDGAPGFERDGAPSAEPQTAALTYADLLGRAERLLAALRAAGPELAPGDVVAVLDGDDQELLAAFWACQLGGYVPAPVRAAGGRAARREAIGAALEVFAEPWLLADREDLPDPGSPPARWLGPVGALEDGGAPSEAVAATRPPRRTADDTAVLLLTSGSTGRPKAVELTHRNILSRCAATVAARGLSAASRSYNWMPLDHVGGLVMFHVRDVYLACTQVHAPMDWVLADPVRWPAGLSRNASTVTWAPNFAFGLLVDQRDRLAGRDWDLSALGYIMNGGEPIKAPVARELLDLLARYGLPRTAMHPGWGMSETSSGVVDCVFDPAAPDPRFVTVGVPHPGTRVRVVDGAGAVAEAGQLGRVQVSGPAVLAGYHRNPEQNRQSFTADGWFKTGDLGFIDDSGLVITGRADDVLDAGEVSYYGHEVEAAVEQLPFVAPSFTVACTVPRDGGPDVLAVFPVLRPALVPGTAAPEAEIARLLRERFGATEALVHPVRADQVPKTGIGKLRRARMRELYLAGRELSLAGRELSPAGES